MDRLLMKGCARTVGHAHARAHTSVYVGVLPLEWRGRLVQFRCAGFHEDHLIVLATHPASLHFVGVRILQVLSWEHGIPCERFVAGTGAAALLEAASMRQPVMFGLSVSLVETIPAAVELAGSLARRLPARCTVVLGGQAFRRAERYSVPDPLTVIRTVDEFRVRLRSIKGEYARAQQAELA